MYLVDLDVDVGEFIGRIISFASLTFLDYDFRRQFINSN